MYLCLTLNSLYLLEQLNRMAVRFAEKGECGLLLTLEVVVEGATPLEAQPDCAEKSESARRRSMSQNPSQQFSNQTQGLDTSFQAQMGRLIALECRQSQTRFPLQGVLPDISGE
jgi:hypothetical protein